jgi:hypothetical protein
VLDSGGESFWVLSGCGNGTWPPDPNDMGFKLCMQSETYTPDLPEGYTGYKYHRDYRGITVDGFSWHDDVYVGGTCGPRNIAVIAIRRP